MNTNQNDNFFKTRHYFKLLLKGVTKIIMRKRADDRLKKLNEMLAKHSIRNKESFANYCDKDWINFFNLSSALFLIIILVRPFNNNLK